MKFSQVPHTLLLVRPASFGYNQETAASNAFQKESPDPELAQTMALEEFNKVVSALDEAGINTIVVDDTNDPVTTDAIFPNNWITTHEDGKIILYPMLSPTRRLERRDDIVTLLQHQFEVTEVIDLSGSEKENKFLEGTGSIIFDHPNRIAYACRSARTDDKLFSALCARLNYKPILFNAVDENGLPIYHTNVMMWVGESMAGVCLDAIHEVSDQEAVLDALADTDHKVIALSYAQMNSFAGNMIEVQNNRGARYLLLSETALRSLVPGQIRELESYATLLPVDIHTIEVSGGGSIRCMVAGIHLQEKR